MFTTVCTAAANRKTLKVSQIPHANYSSTLESQLKHSLTCWQTFTCQLGCVQKWKLVMKGKVDWETASNPVQIQNGLRDATPLVQHQTEKSSCHCSMSVMCYTSMAYWYQSWWQCVYLMQPSSWVHTLPFTWAVGYACAQLVLNIKKTRRDVLDDLRLRKPPGNSCNTHNCNHATHQPPDWGETKPY